MLITDWASKIFNECFSHDFWIFAFLIGAIILFIASCLVIAMAITRSRVLGPDSTFPQLMSTPMISVIMCCKGTHSESYNNFCRNLKMEYPGKVEFIFVVESEKDAAVACAEKAINDTPFKNPHIRSARIVVAGMSYHNAQKIHNMVFGVTCADPNSEYVLFADDDVFFYPGLIDELLVPLIDEPDRCILSTGYEFVAPEPGATVANYAFLMYRMHNLFSFITDRPVLCWGGCWFSPIKLFKDNFVNLIDCYIDGGYSDDTIISCLVQQSGYVCAHPYRATFPNQPDPQLKIFKYFEFLKRQMFVLDTYSTEYNKRVCHSLAFLIISSIWLMIIWDIIAPFAGLIALIGSFSSHFTWSWSAIASVWCILIWILFLISLKWVTSVLLKVSNSVRPPSEQIISEINIFKLFIGVCIHLFLMPFALISIFTHESIVWAGVRYYKKKGKIYKVERTDEKGEIISELFASSVAKAITSPQFLNFLPELEKRFGIV